MPSIITVLTSTALYFAQVFRQYKVKILFLDPAGSFSLGRIEKQKHIARGKQKLKNPNPKKIIE